MHSPTVARAKVQKLPDHLINQIAAGEVVERPASVVKELVENSLDAGATRIEVHLKDGGISEIKIIDNGSGIDSSDLGLCVERHTTSKIHSEEELTEIGTFGFRGEALSSICSVAEVTLQSRTPEKPQAYTLTVSSGTITSDLRPCSGPVGTQITVKDLFSQVPARKKFLRTLQTEFAASVKTLKEVALGNPQTAFYLYHQGKLSSSWTANTRKERFLETIRPDWTPTLIEEASDTFHLEAFLSPSNLIQDRGEVYLVVNSRTIRNRSLVSSVRQAYQEVFGPHHQPEGVLFLEVAPHWVDVNVHPQKLEVRFLKQEQLYGWLLSVLRKRLAAQQVVTEIKLGQPEKPVFNSPVLPPSVAFEVPRPLFEPVFRPSPPVPVSRPVQTVMEEVQPVKEKRPLKYLGQVNAAYLICEDPEGLVLVDQHALHEKLAYEKLVRNFKDKKPETQDLLIPKIIRLPADLLPALEEYKETLSEQGFDIEPYGDGDVAIKSRPALLPEDRLEATLIKTLNLLIEGSSKNGLVEAANPVLATVACHSVVRAGQSLSFTEAQALLDGIDKIELGWNCPHGRPVLFRLSFSEIEKHFERT